MSQIYYSIPLSRCLKTDDAIINEIKNFLCCICGNIPLPAYRDKSNSKNVFCLECCDSMQVNEKIGSSDNELGFLKQLQIDCEKYCDEIFTYENIEKLQIHEKNCNFIETPNPDGSQADDLNFSNMKKKIKDLIDDVMSNSLCKGCGENRYEFEMLKTESNSSKNCLEIIKLENKNNFNELNLKFSILAEKVEKLTDLYEQSNKKMNEFLNIKAKMMENQINNIVASQEKILKNFQNSSNNMNNRFEEIEKTILELNKFQETYKKNKFDDSKNIEDQVKYLHSKFEELNQGNEKYISVFKQNQKMVPTLKYLIQQTSNICNKINTFELQISKIGSEEKGNFNNPFNSSKNFSKDSELKIKELITNEINKSEVLINFKQFINLFNLEKIIKKHRKLPSTKLSESIIFSDNIPDKIATGIDIFYYNLSNLDGKENFQNQYNSVNEEITQFISQMKIVVGKIQKVIPKIQTEKIFTMLLHKNNDKHSLISTSNQSIKFWDLNSNTNVGSIDNAHTGLIHAILIIKNILISGGEDKLIKFWDINTLNSQPGEINNLNPVFNIVDNGNDSFIVGSHININIYHLKNKTLISVIKTNHSEFIKVIVKGKINDKDVIFTGSIDKTIKVWENEICLKNIKNVHPSGLSCIIQLKSDNKILVSSDYNGNIAFININKDFELLRKYDRSYYYKEVDEKFYSTNICELKDKKIIVTTSSISTLTFWSLKNFEIIRNLTLMNGLRCLVGIDDDEGLLVNLGSDIIIWK